MDLKLLKKLNYAGSPQNDLYQYPSTPWSNDKICENQYGYYKTLLASMILNSFAKLGLYCDKSVSNTENVDNYG